MSLSPSPEPTPLKLTPRGVAVVIVAALFAAASALARIGSLVHTFAAGLLAIGLLLYWRLVAVAVAAAASRVRVEREIKGELLEGRKVKVVLTLLNPTPVPLLHLEVYDEPPRLWKLAGQPRRCVTIPPFSKITLSYEAVAVYGRHRFGPIRLIAYDPLGLFRCESIHEEAVYEAIVKPRLLGEVRGAYLMPSSPRPGGYAPSRQKGVGTVFYDVREYVPGDDIRLVYWKGFARTGRLTVKEYEQEVQVYTVFVLDATPSMFWGALGETKIENMARVLHTILRYVVERGDTYRVILVKPDASIEYTPWLRGRASIYRAMQLVSSLEWPQEQPGDVERRVTALEAIPALLPREKTLVFIFTDVAESPGLAELYAERLSRLRLLRHEVQTLIPLTALYEVEMLAKRDEILAKLYTLSALERLRSYQKIIQAFRRRGIPVVATGPVRLAEVVLEALEAYRRMVV